MDKRGGAWPGPEAGSKSDLQAGLQLRLPQYTVLRISTLSTHPGQLLEGLPTLPITSAKDLHLPHQTPTSPWGPAFLPIPHTNRRKCLDGDLLSNKIFEWKKEKSARTWTGLWPVGRFLAPEAGSSISPQRPCVPGPSPGMVLSGLLSSTLSGQFAVTPFWAPMWS